MAVCHDNRLGFTVDKTGVNVYALCLHMAVKGLNLEANVICDTVFDK